MTQDDEYLQVDPRLYRAQQQRGIRGYTSLLLELAGTQELDEPTKKGIFWQLIGWMASEAGRAAARPWQYLTIILLFALFISIAYTWNLLLLMALGAI